MPSASMSARRALGSFPPSRLRLIVRSWNCCAVMPTAAALQLDVVIGADAALHHHVADPEERVRDPEHHRAQDEATEQLRDQLAATTVPVEQPVHAMRLIGIRGVPVGAVLTVREEAE